MTNEQYMLQAIAEANYSVSLGSLPFACIVVDATGAVIWKDHDRVEEHMDPTAHGEINAIRHLCKKLQTRNLSAYTFYTTSEPCPTCFSSLIKAKVQKIYFGAKTEVNASLPISAEEMAKRSTKKIEVIAGILEHECLEQREFYFKNL